jgi:uncharacterized MAPEG superfamily protein
MADDHDVLVALLLIFFLKSAAEDRLRADQREDRRRDPAAADARRRVARAHQHQARYFETGMRERRRAADEI